LLVKGEKYVEDVYEKAVRRELCTVVMFPWSRWLRFCVVLAMWC
jgi:hypothetical protein